MHKILVVDDEASVRDAFQGLLSAEGHNVVTTQSADLALAMLPEEQPEVVVMDVCLPGMSGLEALARIKASHPRLPVIVMTGRGTMETAIEATKRGAFDYHVKPLDPGEMLKTIERALESVRIMERHVALSPDTNAAGSDALIGQAASMQAVYKAIGRVAQTDATVLILGESGTGKELVARAIYQHSRQSQEPLYVVNCAAIPEALLESELFGHERGAFTGAYARRIGKLEQATGGTVFLDEIGDLSLHLQAKLLRVLQHKTFERLGGNETIHVDFRLLAATSQDLDTGIAEGTFRNDLYHRLNVVSIRLPPLRDRLEDIPLLVDYFLGRFSRVLHFEKPPLTHDALLALRQHPWTGNVRELEHCIHRALIFTAGRPVGAEDLHHALQKSHGVVGDVFAAADDILRGLLQRFLAEYSGPAAHEVFLAKVERMLLEEAMRLSDGNQTRAAKLLGLARPTLHARLQKHSLSERP